MSRPDRPAIRSHVRGTWRPAHPSPSASRTGRIETGLADRKFGEGGGDLSDHGGIARGAGERFVGEDDQAGDSEAGGDALEAGGGDFPIGVAAGPAEQIELARRAFGEGD